MIYYILYSLKCCTHYCCVHVLFDFDDPVCPLFTLMHGRQFVLPATPTMSFCLHIYLCQGVSLSLRCFTWSAEDRDVNGIEK